MILDEFRIEWGRLISWFNVKSMQDSQTKAAFHRIKSYPLQALTVSVNEIIEARRPSPGFFPTINELVNGCCNWLDNYPEAKFNRMEFDPEDDPTYPIGKLWDGYGVLQNQGRDDFYAWAAKNRMPLTDRARVLAKWQHNDDKDVDLIVAEVGEQIPF